MAVQRGNPAQDGDLAADDSQAYRDGRLLVPGAQGPRAPLGARPAQALCRQYSDGGPARPRASSSTTPPARAAGGGTRVTEAELFRRMGAHYGFEATSPRLEGVRGPLTFRCEFRSRPIDRTQSIERALPCGPAAVARWVKGLPQPPRDSGLGSLCLLTGKPTYQTRPRPLRPLYGNVEVPPAVRLLHNPSTSSISLPYSTSST